MKLLPLRGEWRSGKVEVPVVSGWLLPVLRPEMSKPRVAEGDLCPEGRRLFLIGRFEVQKEPKRFNNQASGIRGG